MPEISRFFGIVIKMYYREHAPPHFHAEYGEYECEISLKDLSVLVGKFPPRALGMVMEWAAMHQSELLAVWDEAREFKALSKIEPLR
jgi:hypothetical protein